MYPHSTQSSLLKCEACSGAGYGLARECLPLDPSLPQPMGCGVHRGHRVLLGSVVIVARMLSL